MDDLPSVKGVRASGKRLVGDYVVVDDGRFRCAKCDYDFGATEENYKRHLAMRERDIETLGRLWLNPSELVDDDMTFREFYCPDCGTRITTETAKVGTPIVDDMNLSEP